MTTIPAIPPIPPIPPITPTARMATVTIGTPAARTTTRTASTTARTGTTRTETARVTTETTETATTHPIHRRATIRPAPARSWTRMPAPLTAASPPRRRWTSSPRAGVGRGHAPGPHIARAEGKVPGQVEETIQGAHASTLDWRTLLRRYMTDAASHDYSWSVPTGASSTAASISPRSAPTASRPSPSSSTPRARCPRRRSPSSGRSCARPRPRSGPRPSSCSRSTPPCRTPRSMRRTIFPTRSRSRAGAAPTSGPASHGSTSRGYSRGCDPYQHAITLLNGRERVALSPLQTIDI